MDLTKSGIGRLANGGVLSRRSSGWQRVLEQVKPPKDAAKVVQAIPSKLAEAKVAKSGLAVVGGLVGLTAGSAAVSSARRRREASSDGR
jgi:hypothetical protein